MEVPRRPVRCAALRLAAACAACVTAGVLAACGAAPPAAQGRIGAVTSAPPAAGSPDLPGGAATTATNPDGTPVLGGGRGAGSGAGGSGGAGSDGGSSDGAAAAGGGGAGGGTGGSSGGGAGGGSGGGASGPQPGPYPAPPANIVPTSLAGFRTQNMPEDEARAIGGFFGARSALVRWFVAEDLARREVPTIMVFRSMTPEKRSELVNAPVANDVVVGGVPMRRTVFAIPERYGIPIEPGREPIAYVWEKSPEYVVLVTGGPEDVLADVMKKVLAT